MNDSSKGPAPAELPSSRSSQMPTLDPASAAAAAAAGAIEAPPPGFSSLETDVRPTPSRIGPYKLLQVIGEGGFGTVWIADQVEPVKRRVALKIIKAGMDSRAVIARFEQERQALALMDHTNIARVFDAGTAPDGRPFFVMEYVAGEPITNYCDRNRLNVKQRLELFIPVCEAVQHAHHKGIIHRDIKPGNVLVCSLPGNESPSSHGGSGAIVKVIDFGVAKAVSHVLTDKTIFTELGQILGTPEYMSPEQAEMGALDIDTRTDVYALGVLLYEILSGALPFEAKDLRSRGYNEIQRIIREVDPPKPSHRLRSLDAANATDIARRRQIKLDELEGQLRRELEWIPLKAMRKERDERYATPIAMAEDIRNHLAGRPLVAGPESVMYRAKKFVYRNRWGVSAAAMVATALILGAIVSTIGFVKAARNARLAQQESARLRQTVTYNSSLLSQANPTAGERQDITVRELIDEAVKQLDNGALESQPRIDAEMRRSLAQTYRSLSLFKNSEQQWRKTLELESSAGAVGSREYALSLNGLGQVLLDQNQFDAARDSLKKAIAIEREQLEADDPQIADTVGNLAFLAQLQGDYKAAESGYREALNIYNQRPEDATHIADAMTNLAQVLRKLGDDKQALDLATKGLALRRQRLGDKHIDVWNSLFNIAQIQEAQSDLAGAEKTRREARALAMDLLNEKNTKTILSITELARTLWLRGGLDEAQSLQSHANDLAKSVEGDKSLTLAAGFDLLGNIARDRGNLPQAIDMFRKALEMRQIIQGTEHDATAGEMLNLADCLTRAGQSKEAIELAAHAQAIRSKALPDGHWGRSNASSILGGAYAADGQYAQAEPLLLDGYKGLENKAVVGGRPRLQAAGRLVTLYDKWGKPDQAEQWRQRLTQLEPSAKR